MAAWLSANSVLLNEIIYCLCGLISIMTAVRGLQNKQAPIGTFLFWFLLGIMFMTGHWLINNFTWGAQAIGAGMFVLGALVLLKQVQPGKFKEISQKEREKHADKLGGLIFVPALTLAFVAMALSQIKFSMVVDGQTKQVGFSGPFAIGLAAILALVIGIIITKMKPKDIGEGTSRLLMTVGSSSLLPQYLGALGSLFTAAGVGQVISSLISSIVPQNNLLLGIIAYCLGMVIFTMVLGNAFAAFAVITIGIGVPFVIGQGANPVVIGALGMTCGFCGTLLTPMAANFNIVAANVLETKDKYQVIKAQAPVALALIVAHIILMYVLS